MIVWRRPPYGVKDGLLPVLSVAFILSQQEKLAVYREGLFKARFDDVDVDYLAKDREYYSDPVDGFIRHSPQAAVGNGGNRPGLGRNQPDSLNLNPSTSLAD